MPIIERHDTSLLHFLQSRPKPAGRDFRSNPRHDSSADLRLAWTDGKKAHNARGRLINLSRLGAALIVPNPAPAVKKVLLRLDGECSTPWMEAEVLGIEAHGRHRYRIRVRCEPCPTFFLKAAVLEVDHIEDEQEPA